MKNNDIHEEHPPYAEQVKAMTAQVTAQSDSRRRLLKKAGLATVPVVTSLASRPVLAWHCKAPSVMASEALNPNTSLSAKSPTGRRWADETWGLSQWKGNCVRPADSDGKNEWWEVTPPWNAFLKKYPLPTGVSKYWNLKLSQLATMVSTGGGGTLTLPTGIATDKRVIWYLNNGADDYRKRVLIAQLNLLTLNTTNSGLQDNDLDYCITLTQLNQMATGTYRFSSNKTWGPTEIKDYLISNWMAVN